MLDRVDMNVIGVTGEIVVIADGMLPSRLPAGRIGRAYEPVVRVIGVARDIAIGVRRCKRDGSIECTGTAIVQRSRWRRSATPSERASGAGWVEPLRSPSSCCPSNTAPQD
jgi:hypothetical protein